MEDRIKNACEGKSKTQGGLNLTEIQEILRSRGLKSTGTRAVLQELLCTSAAPGVAPPYDAPAPKSAIKGFPTTATEEAAAYEKFAAETAAHKQRVLLDLETIVSNIPLTSGGKRTKVFLEGDILSFMANVVQTFPLEIAGMLDLNLEGKFERNMHMIGSEGAADTTEFSDFEILYHTHPNDRIAKGKLLYEIPSVGDIIVSLMRSSRGLPQVHVVFAPDAVYGIYTKPIEGASAESDIPIIPDVWMQSNVREWEKALDVVYKKYELALRNSHVRDAYFEELKKYGIHILRYGTEKVVSDVRLNWPSKIPIYVDLNEPVLPQLLIAGKVLSSKAKAKAKAK